MTKDIFKKAQKIAKAQMKNAEDRAVNHRENNDKYGDLIVSVVAGVGAAASTYISVPVVGRVLAIPAGLAAAATTYVHLKTMERSI